MWHSILKSRKSVVRKEGTRRSLRFPEERQEEASVASATSGSSETLVREVCDNVNARYFCEGEKGVTKSTVARYVKSGLIGKSPVKRGAPSKLDDELMHAVKLHMSMKQATRLGDPRAFEVKAIMRAATSGTGKDKFSVRYAWDKLRRSNPDEMQPSGTSKTEDLRAQFTTWQNLNDWFTFTKPVMVETGLAFDKEQILPGNVQGWWRCTFVTCCLF